MQRWSNSGWAWVILILLPSLANGQDFQRAPNISGAVLYDHNPSTRIGDNVFGNVVADFAKSTGGEPRCSHGGPVCMEYGDGTLVAFYANTSSHNEDGWSEYALSKDHGKTWDKYHPFSYSQAAYKNDPKRPLWVEEGLVTRQCTAVLFLTQFENGRRIGNSITRSGDHGVTWSEPQPLGHQLAGYPAAVAVVDDENYVLFDSLGGEHELYTSTDDGKTWSKRSTLPLLKSAWYGALCAARNGELLAGAYVTQDEQHFYYCVSQDKGRTWSNQRTAYLDKKIRDPELAYLDGKYYLHGRSGQSGPGSHRFVLYQSDDGVSWKDGVIVSRDARGPDGYSHNCIIHRYQRDVPEELMILYSIIYDPPRTSEYVFFVKPEHAR